MNYEAAYQKVKEFGQEHILKYYEELTEAEQAALLAQIEKTDLKVLTQIESAQAGAAERGKIQPIYVMKVDEIKEKEAKAKSKTSEARAERRSKLAEKADK